MVTGEADRSVLAHQLNAVIWVSAVADEVAKTPEFVGVDRIDRCQNGL